MNAKLILQSSLRLLLVWLMLSISILFLSEALIALLLPYLTWCVNLLSNHYTSLLTIVNDGVAAKVQIVATITQAVYISGIPVSPPGVKLTGSINLIHALVPVVILYVILLCWPVRHFKERLLMCILGIPAVLLIMALTVPTLLAGHIEATLLSAAERASGRDLDRPFIMDWVIFVETGGRWLLPLLAAILCILIIRALFHRSSAGGIR